MKMIPAVLLCAFILWVMCARKKGASDNKDAPVYSNSLPIIGITHLFFTYSINFWQMFKRLAKDASQHGGVIRAKTGLGTCYVITDPQDAATVANVCLEKHYAYNFARCWLGDSLLTAPVPVWKRHRKLLSPAYSSSMINGFIKAFNEQAVKLVDEMSVVAGKGPFKVAYCLQNNILRSACLTAFGGNNLHDEKMVGKYVHAINELAHLVTERAMKYWQHSDLLYYICGKKTKQDKLIKDLNDVCNGILQKEQTTAVPQRTNNNCDDRNVDFKTFLDIYLKINSSNALTDRELREELELTIAASFDTTAMQFQSVLIYVGSHPEVQQRIFEEIIQEIDHENDVDKDAVNRLVYTEAVIKEVLRLAPVAPVVGRYVQKDVQLKNCTLRAGTYAAIVLYGVNRHSSWGPDANQFRPERWLEPGGVPNMSSAFATFSIGKRGCIGKTYAMTLMKITLSHIIRKFKIEADYTKVVYKYDVLLKPVKGHDIRLISRNIT